MRSRQNISQSGAIRQRPQTTNTRVRNAVREVSEHNDEVAAFDAGVGGASRVPVTKVRNDAWQVPQPQAAFPAGVDPEALRNVLSGNKDEAARKRADGLLDILCRPVGQRARMQKHWNGDPDSIEATRILFGPVLAGEIMNAIAYPKEAFEKPQWYPFLETAIDYVKDVVQRMQPRDELERMLIEQSLWLHARVARLSVQAATTTYESKARILNEAADRASNTFRRHLLALKEYRSAQRPKVVMPIQSAHIANVAGQQVVNALGASRNRCFRFLHSRGTKRNMDAIEAQKVSAISSGTRSEASEHPMLAAVAANVRPDHCTR
jgi:hypothetical protein